MPEPWIWDRSSGYHTLARYASVTALRRLALEDRRAYQALSAAAGVSDADGREAARRVVRRLYEALRDREYPYGSPAWYLGGKQRLRDPMAIHQGSGTCLDLALMFAAMCKAAGLSPFLVMLEGHGREQPDHALVLVQLGGRLRMDPPVGPAEKSPGEIDPWGVQRLVSGTDPVVLTEDGLAIDVTAACGWSRVGFTEACRWGEEALTDRGYRNVHLVNILAVQRHEADVLGDEGEARPPTGTDRPAIYTNLPSMRLFHPYGSRQEEARELLGSTGLVVVCGPSGSGKSMLAHHMAATIDHGCGWFLDASSVQALTVALAGGEAREAGRLPESVDGPELARLRANALDRLKNTDGPWAVVLDNANGDPSEIGTLPVPVASRNQLLIVTTTNDEWTKRTSQVIALGPLSDQDMEKALGGSPPLTALAGRPLFVDASQRFHQATGRWWWETHPVEPDHGTDQVPGIVWAAVDDELAHDAVSRSVARAISWLPPVRLPRASVIAAIADDGAPGAIASLERLGLIDAEAGDITMHGLFRRAVRDDAMERDAQGQVRLVHQLLTEPATQRIMEFAADLDTANSMGRLLAASADTRIAVTGLHALGRLFERHETASKSAHWYGLVLNRVGWKPGSAAPMYDYRIEVVDSLRGKARAVMRETRKRDGPKKLDEAIGWVQEAEFLCAGREDRASRLAASQAEAMRGLLLRKRADKESSHPATVLRTLREAERALRHSADERKELVDNPPTSPEVDRSQYNLAGLEVRLAKTDAPAEAAGHLSEADHHYSDILSIRERRYRTDEMEEVVCCINGQALVAYYRAVLLPGSWQDKLTLLRTATQRAQEAAAIRQRLAGELDDDNTSKSLALLAKIALARTAVTQEARKRGESDEETIASYQSERAALLSSGSPDSVERNGGMTS